MKTVLEMIGIAAEELKSLKGYERANIACRIAEIMLGIHKESAAVPGQQDANVGRVIAPPKKGDLENKPKEKKAEEAAVEFRSLNPAADVQKMVGDSIPIKEAETAAPAPKKEEALPSDWADRILRSDEMDDTWTERMKANNDLMTHITKLGKFIQTGLKKSIFSKEWINQKAAEVTDGRIKDITTNFPSAVPPKVVKMMCAYITDETRRLMEKQKNAA